MTVNRAAGKYGNALVGIYDASNNLLWSYHIWAPEDNPTTYDYTATSSGNTYKVLNMPIGAIKYATISSSNADKIKALPLLYQYGRKDPLGRWNGTGSGGTNIVTVYDKFGNTMNLTDAAYIEDAVDISNTFDYTATPAGMSMVAYHMIKYTISHPTIFLVNNSSATGYPTWTNEEVLRGFWGTESIVAGIFEKSIFDPSPEGYCLPSSKLWYNFTSGHYNATVYYNDIHEINAVGNESFNWTSTNNTANGGYAFYYQGLGSGPSHFYVNGMYREWSAGTLSNAARTTSGISAGIYWTNWPVFPDGYTRALSFGPEKVCTEELQPSAIGAGVICVRYK